MERFSFIVAFILVISSSVIAQKTANDGVRVTGTVAGVEAKCIDGKPAVELRLQLQFHNESNKPLLLIRPAIGFTTRISFLAHDLGYSDISTVASDMVRYNPYQSNPFGPATKDDYDPMAALVRDPAEWKAPDPLQPGAYFGFPQTVWLRNGFRIKGKKISEQKACGPTSFAPVPEYESFQVEYNLSLKRYPSASDLLTTLQTRWSPLGHLPLDSNGDVTYRSEAILFANTK